jgi:ribonuclease R
MPKKIIEGGEGVLKEEVLTVFEMSETLRKNRFDDGALAFEKDEVKFRLDEEGKPAEVYIKEYKESNKLVEEFMLLANRSVAKWCSIDKSNNARTYVYRIHDEPSQERLETLVQVASTMEHKVQLGPRKVLTSSLNKLLSDIKGTGEENMLSTLTIRCMAKAVYSTENIGHYGLGFDFYSHFTSPIRRYPDVIAHRLLQRYLDGGKSLHDSELERRCKHCSEMEKKATDAERASTKFMQAKYLAEHVGEKFAGLISGVTEWGVFVELKENRCEGMIRLKDMNDDFYAFNEKTMTVSGSTTGNTLRLGDEINIRVKRVSVEKRQIDLKLLA